MRSSRGEQQARNAAAAATAAAAAAISCRPLRYQPADRQFTAEYNRQRRLLLGSTRLSPVFYLSNSDNGPFIFLNFMAQRFDLSFACSFTGTGWGDTSEHAGIHRPTSAFPGSTSQTARHTSVSYEGSCRLNFVNGAN